MNIVTAEALQHVLPDIRDVLLLVKETTSAIYVRDPLPPGQDCIQKLHNLRQHRLSPISSTFYIFQDTIVH